MIKNPDFLLVNLFVFSFLLFSGERPFVCDFKSCQKSFTRNEELTRHRRIHSGVRPYPCHWCDKRFGRKDHLRKHERTHERRLRSTIFLNYTANIPGFFPIPEGSNNGTVVPGPVAGNINSLLNGLNASLPVNQSESGSILNSAEVHRPE